MVYAMLLTALATGSALEGGLIMLAFGLGTLPNLLLIAALFHRAGTLLKSKTMRLAAGAVLASVGVFSIVQSFEPAAWNHATLLCQWLPQR
jgi:sulfite exporter TauE/SafE